MRNWSVHFLAAILALSLTGTAYAQQKIAVVDLEKLIRLHPNTAEDKKTLEGTLKDFNKQKEQLQALAVSTRKAYEAAVREATNPALSEAARKKAEAVAMDKRQAALEADRGASEKIRELQRELNAQEMKMLRRTSDIIERAVAAYARGNGIDIVLQLPSRLSPGTGVIYSRPEMDITEEIMKLLGIEEPADEDAEPESSEVESPKPEAASPEATPEAAKPEAKADAPAAE
jgi:Skp family chaperone for outer membrane proteins